jgi:hypothetical protein
MRVEVFCDGKLMATLPTRMADAEGHVANWEEAVKTDAINDRILTPEQAETAELRILD